MLYDNDYPINDNKFMNIISRLQSISTYQYICEQIVITSAKIHISRK